MKKDTLLYAFSIFAMFFGSGNLVYPLEVGIFGLENWHYSYIGFFCTGIILPFLGLFVIKLHKGNYYDFFAEAGELAKFALPLITLSLLGSFGVIPRCITVAHGGLEFLFPNMSLVLFSIIFCASCYIFCIKDNFMFNVLGKILTPLLLLFLAILIIYGINNANIIHNDGSISKIAAFNSGFNQGYNTMDLLAAFFFSSLIFKQIELNFPKASQAEILRMAITPSIIGALMLAIVYLGFVYLGAHYKEVVSNTIDLSKGELILPTIATHVLGTTGSFIIAVIIILSCLTTAVALNRIYAKYLCQLFKLEDKFYPLMLFVTTTASFLLSTLNFNGIAAILGPILKICYPALIVLTLMSIILKGYKPLKIVIFYGVLMIMTVTGIM